MPNHKPKGNYFENKVASIIRESLNISEFELHKNSDSGNNSIEFGDIRTPFPWLIECKFWNSFNYARLIKDWNVLIKDFMLQLEKDVDKFKKKFHKKPFYTVVTASPYNPIICSFKKENFYDNDFFNADKPMDYYFGTYINYPEIIVVDIKEFLEFLRKIKDEGRSSM